MSWWRPADRQVARHQRELREARASIGRLSTLQAETLRQLEAMEAARDEARAQLDAVQRVEREHADRLHRLAALLADQSLATVDCPVCTRARQVLVEGPEPGPVSGGGQQ